MSLSSLPFHSMASTNNSRNMIVSRFLSSSSTPQSPIPKKDGDELEEQPSSTLKDKINDETEPAMGKTSSDNHEKDDDLEKDSSGSSNNDKKDEFLLPFPWRSSSEPLTRVLEFNDLSGLPNNSRSRFVRKALAARELDIPWYQILLTRSWEKELAGQFSWAFSKALAAIMAHSYQVPIDAIEDDDSGHIQFDSTKYHESKLIKDEAPGESESNEVKESSSSEQNNTENEESSIDTENMKTEMDNYVASMLDENLIQIYNNTNKLLDCTVKLDMKVVDWKLESAFVVPMFTREDVKINPKLKGAYQAIEQEFSQSGNVQLVREMGEQLAKETNFSGDRVIIADVSIYCMESLQISCKDNDTDDVLIQGSKEYSPQEVMHLVRFEMITKKNEEHSSDSGRKITNWKIIDWDDLLDGNIWH